MMFSVSAAPRFSSGASSVGQLGVPDNTAGSWACPSHSSLCDLARDGPVVHFVPLFFLRLRPAVRIILYSFGGDLDLKVQIRECRLHVFYTLSCCFFSGRPSHWTRICFNPIRFWIIVRVLRTAAGLTTGLL